jgi:protein TonB
VRFPQLAMPGFPASRRLELAIAISLMLHVLLLSLHFQFPDAANAMREKAMDIVLVNSKSAKKPREAQALAQANLDGGGNTDENRRAKTPLRPRCTKPPALISNICSVACVILRRASKPC